MSESATARLTAAAHTHGGIRLHNVSKSFRGPQGPIRAVRGIDVSIAAGETAALLGPNGAGKSTTIDMLLGLSTPDAGTVSVFGRPPRESVDAGLVGAMLQTGGLIRDLSVRELVAMMASLYPDPMDVRRRSGHGTGGDRRPANAQALRRRDPARPVRARDRLQPRTARARRADRRA